MRNSLSDPLSISKSSCGSGIIVSPQQKDILTISQLRWHALHSKTCPHETFSAMKWIVQTIRAVFSLMDIRTSGSRNGLDQQAI